MKSQKEEDLWRGYTIYSAPWIKVDLVLGGKLLVSVLDWENFQYKTCIYGDVNRSLGIITKELCDDDGEKAMINHISALSYCEQYNKIPTWLEQV